MPPDPRLELHLLGAMEAVTRGPAGDRRLGKGKPVALLAFLSLAPGRRASRERLATLLWSDGSSETARQNLRQTLWYLKRRLGEILVADDDTVALAPDSVSDVDTFVQAAQTERFGDALGAYRGDLVPEFAAPGAAAFEEWADLERRRLRATFVGCVEAATRTLLGSGQAGQALPLARRARELASDDANTWRILLECLIAARDQLGATAAVAHLEAEIERGDTDADPAIRSLLRAARKLAGNGEVESTSAESPENSLVPDLIGREAEFRTLVDAWEGARRGRGRALLLTGAAGLGKTRLLTDFAARVSSTRGRTVQVRAHQGNRTISASLAAQIAEALAALPGAAAVSTGSASVLVALSPLLASSFPGAEPDRATGEDALRRRAAALGDLLGVLCESAPLAVLIDDAHWADSESMRLVGALRSRVEGARALLVVASRIPEDLRHHLGSVEEVALRPLDVAGVAEFVGRLASVPTEPWSRGLVPRLHELSHGIPLLLIETLQRLVESGALARREGHWHAESAAALEAAMPPGSALRARLETLGARERTALVRLATLGRPIATTGLSPDALVPDWDAVLGELERRNFVTQSEQRVGAWHDEIARGVLDLATPDDRLEAHAWASELLLSQVTSFADFRLAALHAFRSADDDLLERVWNEACLFARARRDTRAARLIAADVLPAEIPDLQRERLVRSAPSRWHGQRASLLVLTTVVMAAVAFAVKGALAGGQSPYALMFLRSDQTAAAAWRLELPLQGTWDADEPLRVRSVALTETPWRGSLATSDASPLPTADGWLSHHTFGDSTGDEVVLIRRDGALERVSPAAGDDNGEHLSPDGRQVVFYTRRYDRDQHQAELAIHDLNTNVTRRLTTSADDEVVPIWSPDGTRIAFRRYFQTLPARDPQSCIRSIDGMMEQCEWAGLPTATEPVAWIDASSLLVQVRASDELYRVDANSGAATFIGRPRGTMRPIHGIPFVHCACVDPVSLQPTMQIAPVSNPMALRAVTDGTRLLPPLRYAFPLGPQTGRYLQRLAFDSLALRVPLDASGVVTVRGHDQEGTPIKLHAVRFESSDPAVFQVGDDGTIRPRAIGNAWVRVSAGGWRVDSNRVRIVESSTRFVHAERWTTGIEPTWRAFGVPAPSIVATPGGPALSPNGDGVYTSGVYLDRSLPTAQGLGARFEIQVPVTALKFQSVAAGMYADPAPEELRAWDHVTAVGPLPRLTLCATAFPPEEGGFGALRFGVFAATNPQSFSSSPPPPDFYSQRWHVIELQYTPDGRCALNVDGVEVARSARPATVPATARFVLAGHSKGTRVLIRRVEVWEGVRPPATPAP